jgi:hypothetical protein
MLLLHLQSQEGRSRVSCEIRSVAFCLIIFFFVYKEKLTGAVLKLPKTPTFWINPLILLSLVNLEGSVSSLK